jgi:hypothetical protein
MDFQYLGLFMFREDNLILKCTNLIYLSSMCDKEWITAANELKFCMDIQIQNENFTVSTFPNMAMVRIFEILYEKM